MSHLIESICLVQIRSISGTANMLFSVKTLFVERERHTVIFCLKNSWGSWNLDFSLIISKPRQSVCIIYTREVFIPLFLKCTVLLHFCQQFAIRVVITKDTRSKCAGHCLLAKKCVQLHLQGQDMKNLLSAGTKSGLPQFLCLHLYRADGSWKMK